ncbi:pepsin-like aspartyl protease, partial [Salmonella enterica subsp. enterica serovar Typhimurium]|nr:pepsin-like aspartyl protease [Salmonella enterica subsp. enterica serovar Typhimurium]
MHEFIDTQYAGEVVIDSQTFLLVFDTSSPYVIVPSLECMGGSCACVSTQKYVGSADGDGQNVTVTYFDFAQATGTVIDVSLTIVDLTSP